MTRSNPLKSIGIVGAGGHAKVVVDTILRHGVYTPRGYYDDDAARHGEQFYHDLPICGGMDALLADLAAGRLNAAFVAIGYNPTRVRLGQQILDAGHTLATVIDPHAMVSTSVRIAPGTLVVAGAIINADAQIGAHGIINTGASVDHDCVIEDGVHIAPHATLCGGVKIGRCALIGAGATLIPGVCFPAESTLGGGSTVIRPLEQPGIYAGSPAQRLTP